MTVLLKTVRTETAMGLTSIAAWFAVGAGLSLLHLAVLARSVGRLGGHAGLAAVVQTMGGYLARYASLLIGLVLALRSGALAGIVLALGYWVARWLGVWVWMRREVRSPNPV